MKIRLIKYISILICFVAVLTLCACYSPSDKMIFSGEAAPTKTVAQVSFTDKLTKKEIMASDGNLTLYLDTETGAPAVKNTLSGKIWYALPDKVIKKTSPCVLWAKVIFDGTEYTLNSQNDSVAYKDFFIEKTDNGCRVIYNLSIKEEGSDKQKLFVGIPTLFEIKNGSFYASVETENIEIHDDDIYLTDIGFMDYFAGGNSFDKGDYFVLPDNSGAVFYPALDTGKYNNLSFKVYGDENGSNCLLPAYGAKAGTDAVAAVIEKGDAAATVNLMTKATHGLYCAGPTFTLREKLTEEGKNKTEVMISNAGYEGEIRICYRFLSGNNADYSGMSISCREQLIRNGTLSSDTVTEESSLPFVLSVIASDYVKGHELTILTDYDQLYDMLTYLKGKGFNNIYTKYKGLFTGGTAQNNLTDAKVQSILGSNQSYKTVRDYMQAQQMKFFPAVNISSALSGSAPSSACIRDLEDKTLTVRKQNAFGNEYDINLLNLKQTEKNVLELFDLAGKINLTAVDIEDAGAFICSSPDSRTERNEIADNTGEKLTALTTIGDVMVTGGNFYALKNVNMVSSLPLRPSHKTSDCYIGIPFIQMIIHGTLDYSSAPLNFEGNFTNACLKAVEYGASPEFEWCYEDVKNENGDTDGRFSFYEGASEAYNFYEKASAALSDLRNKRITAHRRLRKAVYLTEYSDTLIYVNYNNRPVNVNGITVPAKDFVRIN